MPEKDGAEEKSTKSVVNKKQKLGEEGYDIARDMGRVRPSKDKKDATTMPPSKEMKKTQKVNKGPSALDIVKKKYEGQIMNVGKKKVKEELDLTQVAEAFGGYIIESQKKDPDTRGLGQSQRKIVKKQKKIIKSPESQAKDKLATQKQIAQLKKVVSTTAKTDPIVDKEMGALGKTGAKVQKEIETETGRKTRKFTPASGTGLPTDVDDATTGVAPGEKTAPVYSFRIGTEREGPVAKARREKAEAEAAAKRSAAASERNRNRKLVGSGSKEVSPEVQKQIDRIKKEIDQRDTKKKKEKEIRDIITPDKRKKPAYVSTSSPGFGEPKTPDQKPFFSNRPKGVGDTRTGLRRSFKDFRKKLDDEGDKLKDFRGDFDKTKSDFDKIKPRTDTVVVPKPETQTTTEPETQTAVGGQPPIPPKRTAVGAGDDRPKKPDAFSSIKKFAKKNPQIAAAGALAGYDLGKGILSKIMNLKGPGLRGGTVGRRSAGTFTAT
jgi:hypothetical protein